MRNDILERKADILKWIDQKESKAYICRQLNCKAGTLETYLKKMGINYSGNKGLKNKKVSNSKLSLKELLSRDWVSSHKIRIRLINDGIKKHQCECCGITEWMGKPAPLELDHIDGNHHNNDLTNLRILCPNCHSQTETNSGKNIKPR